MKMSRSATSLMKTRSMARTRPAKASGFRELAGRPALFAEVVLGDELFQEPQLIVGVDNCVVGLQSYQLGMSPQHLRPDRVEGAEPGHALDRAAGDGGDALLHLARGLVGEGHGEDL